MNRKNRNGWSYLTQSMRDSKLSRLRYLRTAALAAGAAALILLANSCSTDRAVIVPLQIEGATYVGDKACFDCHANISRAFPSSPHSRLHFQNALTQNGCESCHGPGSKHIAMAGRWGEDKFIINPRKDPEACFQCHQETRAEFHLPQHHPVLEGKMNCVQCHDPHGTDILKPARGLAMSRLNETCAQCHREETKPLIFEHAALREGCTVCHNPHGSINAKMLVERDASLCLKCHSQTQNPAAPGHIFIGNLDHTTFLRFGTCWTAGCHSAVHGSNTQPFYFY